MFITHHYICDSCKTENKITVSESDRGEFQIKKGDTLMNSCRSCHRKEQIHINNIYAKGNPLIVFIVAGLSILACITLFLIVYNSTIINKSVALTFIPLGLPVAVMSYQNNLTRNFNNYHIRKK